MKKTIGTVSILINTIKQSPIRFLGIGILAIIPLISAPVSSAATSKNAVLQVTAKGTVASITQPKITVQSNSVMSAASYPADTQNLAVVPGVATHIIAYAEYNTTTCALVSSGAFTTVTAPVHGTLTYG